MSAKNSPAKNVASEYKVALPPGESATVGPVGPVPPAPRSLPRLMSLDAYRGFIMLAMASSGFGIPLVAAEFPGDERWVRAAYQFDHVPWVGWSFWDLIQPAFMFMVGVAMEFSYASRQAKGQSYGRMLWHAFVRANILIWLGVFLRSAGHSQTHFTFIDVISQIGIVYVFLFLLWNRHIAWQALAIAIILVGTWGAFYFHPLPPDNFDYASVGIDENWERLTGMAAHWEKNTNPAAKFDRWFLNLFPREREYTYDPGGYATPNCIPSLATMIFGLMAGQWLRTTHGGALKLLGLLVGGATLAAGGYLLDGLGICPLVKRIWTPSWAIFSAGMATLMLAAFYFLIDVLWLRRPAWPFVVVGMNSIVIYCMSKLIGGWHGGWIRECLTRHFGAELFTLYGRVDAVYEPIVAASLVLFVMWGVCAWLWSQRVFIRI